MTWTPDNSNFFRFPLKVRVIGSRLYLQWPQGNSAGKMQAQNNLDPTVFSFFDMAWVRKPWGLGKAQNPNSPIITLHLRFTKGASDHKTPGGGGWRYSLIRPIRRFAALWARLKFYLTPKKCHSKTHNQKRTTTILCILLLLSSFLYAQP